MRDCGRIVLLSLFKQLKNLERFCLETLTFGSFCDTTKFPYSLPATQHFSEVICIELRKRIDRYQASKYISEVRFPLSPTSTEKIEFIKFGKCGLETCFVIFGA